MDMVNVNKRDTVIVSPPTAGLSQVYLGLSLGAVERWGWLCSLTGARAQYVMYDDDFGLFRK